MNRSQLRILLCTAVLEAVGLALPAQAALAPTGPAKAADAPKPSSNETDLGAKFIDTGPGKDVGKIAPPSPDALDEADTSALLDRRTEAAIQRGLQFLKSTQGQDGRWDASDTNWVGYTAFATIAFMLNGHCPNKKPPYGETLTKAVDALLKETEGQVTGYMGSNMYSHGLATLALSEAWGQTDKDDKVQEALKLAVKVILSAQNEAGGWRYNPQPADADVSVTAMQVVALAAARQAGIFVPDETITRAVRYVNMCHQSESGGFSYQAGLGPAGFSRTAAATFSLMMLGRHDFKEVKDGVRYLQQEAPKAMKNTAHYMYGHYYASLVMYQAGSQDFKDWYPQIRDIMLSKQAADGSFAKGGRSTYDTAIALIILSIPYGYVPAYQR
ncbi:MAG TPA: prenyltransferase/squalene oxidase repeat-containing protein [Phycisphaerae bacterium]|nr:prenyltransferase/squalene oxidase repeat-containing protein [Phycisphaerae bacterium]